MQEQLEATGEGASFGLSDFGFGLSACYGFHIRFLVVLGFGVLG